MSATGTGRRCSGGGEGLANYLLELGEVEGLAHEGQARLREEAMQLGGSDAPRQEDDPRHGVALPFGQRAIEADAIELRHVEIAEDQVEVGVPDLLEGGHAVLRAVDVVAFHVERVYDESNDEGIIVDDEDSSRDTRRGNGRLISGHGACLDLLEEQGTGQLFRAVKSGIYRASEIGAIFKLSVRTPKQGDLRNAS